VEDYEIRRGGGGKGYGCGSGERRMEDELSRSPRAVGASVNPTSIIKEWAEGKD